MKKKIAQKIAISVNIDDDLASIIKRLKAEGVKTKDFDKVMLNGDYEHIDGDPYYYGPAAYSDLRFEFRQ